MMIDVGHLQAWIGRTEAREERLSLAPVAGLTALLDHPCVLREGDPLPELAHWLYFVPTARQSDIDVDGHPRRGGFLPPVPLPRRMWAGSTIEFRLPLKIGQTVQRLQRVESVRCKEGRSGALVFVQVTSEYANDDGIAIVERQDIVYRDAPAPREMPAALNRAQTDHAWMRTVQPDPVLLFRYSALTFNSHRIHYDLPYARDVECYPGLVVHGPLVAALLLDLLKSHRPNVRINAFTFRAVRPLFDTGAFEVCGAPADGVGHNVRLWTRDQDGATTMEASAVLAA
ncbi:MAG: MaoC family dehydratase N-terminal domain-containing protein [Sinimarinibacterium sp.]|jgi:3-methylfumaryl-CoA hydratase